MKIWNSAKILTAIGILFAVCTGKAFGTTYAITDLGTLGGSSSYGVGINNTGQVTGESDTAGIAYSSAFLYSGGTMTNLGTLGGSSSAGYRINDVGQVVGSYFSEGHWHAFLYSGETITDFGNLGGLQSMGHGINNAGQMVGWYTTDLGISRAFLYCGGAMTDLGTLGGEFGRSWGHGINNAGQVTGESDTKDGNSRAFLYSGGALIDLGTLGGWRSGGNGINDTGQVVGFSSTAGDISTHAFLYSGGTMTDLGTLGGSYSCGYGINNVGQMVGTSENSVGYNRAFLYSGGTMYDLNHLIPSGSGWTLIDARGINDSGQITGRGWNRDGQLHAFLLTPGNLISGTVTNFYTLAPLAGTGVKIEGQSYYTDSAGKYATNAFVPGSYTITAGKDGFISVAKPATVVVDTPTTVNFSLKPALVISGTVINANSDPPAKPLTNAQVTIYGQTYQTDSSGNYTTNSLPNGTYAITVVKTGFNTQTTTVTLTDTPVTRNFSLTPKPITVTKIESQYPQSSYFLPDVDLPVNFTATIDWNGHDPGKVKFITSYDSHEVTTGGTTADNTLNVGSEFKPCEALKVVAVAGAGDNTKSAEKKADFLVTQKPFAFDNPLGTVNFWSSTLRYKTDISFTNPLIEESTAQQLIPAGVPVIGNSSIGFRFMPDLSLEFDSTNGEATYGIKLSNAMDNQIKEELDPFYQRRGEPMGLNRLFDYLLAGINNGKVDSSKLPNFMFAGSSAKFYPAGDIKATFDPLSCNNGTDSWKLDGNIGLAGEVELAKTWQFPPTPFFPYVPWYAKIKAGLGADLLFNVNDTMTNGYLSGAFSLGPQFSGTAGLGITDLLGVDATVSGNAKARFALPTGLDRLEYQAEVFGSWTALGFSGRFINLGPWSGCEPESACPSGSAAFAAGRSMALDSTPTLIPRDYLAASNTGTFRRTPAYAIRTFATEANPYSVAITPIVTSAYPLSGAFLSSAGDKVNLLWVTDNANRSAVNRTMLVHAAFDGTAWSAPQPVADDGTADFHPVSLTFPDGTIIAAWEDEKAELPDTATLNDAAAGLQISTSVYNPATKSWSAVTRITADNFLHHTPKLAGISRNNVLLTWLGNESNDLYGSSVKPNKLWYSTYNGTAWSPPQVAASGPVPIKRYAVAYDGEKAEAVFATHASDDISTLDNLVLVRFTWSNGSWSSPSLLTYDNAINDNPQLALDSANNFILTWVHGGELSSVVNFDFNTRTIIRNDTQYSSNLADFKQAVTTDGKVAVIYAQPSVTSSSDLFGVFYDPVFATWSQPKQLTADAETEQHPSIAFLGAETIIATYNRKLMLNTDGTTPTGTNYTDLYMLKHTLGVDLALDGNLFTVSPPNPAPGESATFTVTARNVGDKPVANAKVAFYKGNPASGGIKIGETTITETFNAGESKESSITWTIPATATPLTIYGVIDPDAALDPLSRSDNTISKTIVMPDLAMSMVSWQKLTDSLVTVTARVSNSGSLPTTPTTVVFRRDGPTGTVLSTQTLPALVKGGTVDFAMTFDAAAFTEPYYTICVTADEANSVTEFDENNNGGSVIFPGKEADIMKQLDIQITGSGGGTVSDIAAGLSCGSNCQKTLVWNTPLSLTALPFEYSLFTGWTWAGCSGTGICAFSITAPVTVNANFDFDKPHSVRVDGTPNVFYSSLQNAFAGAAANSLVRAWGVTFTENLVVNRNFVLKGGYDSGYTSQTGTSSVKGTVRIGQGSLVVERMEIK